MYEDSGNKNKSSYLYRGDVRTVMSVLRVLVLSAHEGYETDTQRLSGN